MLKTGAPARSLEPLIHGNCCSPTRPPVGSDYAACAQRTLPCLLGFEPQPHLNIKKVVREPDRLQVVDEEGEHPPMAERPRRAHGTYHRRGRCHVVLPAPGSGHTQWRSRQVTTSGCVRWIRAPATSARQVWSNTPSATQNTSGSANAHKPYSDLDCKRWG